MVSHCSAVCTGGRAVYPATSNEVCAAHRVIKALCYECVRVSVMLRQDRENACRGCAHSAIMITDHSCRLQDMLKALETQALHHHISLVPVFESGTTAGRRKHRETAE